MPNCFPKPEFEFPAQLVSALARRDCVIVVGAGVSAASVDSLGNHPPTWAKLLTEMAGKLGSSDRTIIEKLINDGDYLTAAEVVRVLGGEMLVCEVLENEFVHKRYSPNAVHVQLAKLAQNVYITPNYDTIFDTYMRTEFDGGISVKDQTQSDILSWIRNGNVLIVKNHGTIDNRATIVLTRRQYAEQRVLNAAFFRVVDALFLTKTVLFVGCGYTDPDFQLLMEDTALAFPTAPPHYMIRQYTSANEIIDRSVEDLRNIKMIYYEDDHSKLPSLLEYLVTEVDSKRTLI